MGKTPNTVTEVPFVRPSGPNEPRSRTRPGDVPAHMEPVNGVPPPPSALEDVIAGEPLYVPPVASGVAPESAPLPSPPPPTLYARVGDVEERESQRDRHLLLLDRIVEQQTEQIRELRSQLGLPAWKPTIRAEDNPATDG
jgi:hypothetical protein